MTLTVIVLCPSESAKVQILIEFINHQFLQVTGLPPQSHQMLQLEELLES